MKTFHTILAIFFLLAGILSLTGKDSGFSLACFAMSAAQWAAVDVIELREKK